MPLSIEYDLSGNTISLCCPKCGEIQEDIVIASEDKLFICQVCCFIYPEIMRLIKPHIYRRSFAMNGNNDKLLNKWLSTSKDEVMNHHFGIHDYVV